MEISDLELQARYGEVFDQYIKEAPILAKELEKFGRIRKELGALLDEMRKRKLSTNLDYTDSDGPKIDR